MQLSLRSTDVRELRCYPDNVDDEPAVSSGGGPGAVARVQCIWCTGTHFAAKMHECDHRSMRKGDFRSIYRINPNPSPKFFHR